MQVYTRECITLEYVEVYLHSKGKSSEITQACFAHESQALLVVSFTSRVKQYILLRSVTCEALVLFQSFFPCEG